MTTDTNGGEESDGAQRWYEALKRLDALQDVYEIVTTLATTSDQDYDEECPFCRAMPGYLPVEHSPNCIVTKARAILGK